VFGIPAKELKTAVIVALVVKLASLMIIYSGWRLADREVYYDGEGKVVDLWITRTDTAFIDNLANFDGAWFARIAALGGERLARQDYDLEQETQRLRVMDQLGYDQGRWPPEPGTDRFDRGYGWRHWPGLAWLLMAPTKIGLDPVHSGVILSNLFTFLYGVLLYLLARKDLGAGAAVLAVTLSQFHPGGYSLSGLYNESMFLAIAAAAMLSARSGKWGLAGAFAMAAASTRIFGAVLAAPLLYEWLEQRAERETGVGGARSVIGIDGVRRALAGLREWPGVWWLGLVPLGTLAVLAYFQAVAGDAMIWSKVHESNVHGQVNWPWLMMMETYKKGWVVASKELPLHALLLVVLVLSAKKVRGSYWLWMLLFFLYHTSNGNHSYLRYQVQCLPMFVAMAAIGWNRKWLWPAVVFVFFMLFVFFGAMWVNGYWVA